MNRGPQFKSSITEAVCLGILREKDLLFGVLPSRGWSSGALYEAMERSLAIVSSRFYENWDEYLPAVIYAYNTKLALSLGVSVGQLVLYYSAGDWASDHAIVQRRRLWRSPVAALR